MTELDNGHILSNMAESFQGLMEADGLKPFGIFKNVLKPRACLSLSKYAKALQSLVISSPVDHSLYMSVPRIADAQ